MHNLSVGLARVAHVRFYQSRMVVITAYITVMVTESSGININVISIIHLYHTEDSYNITYIYSRRAPSKRIPDMMPYNG